MSNNDCFCIQEAIPLMSPISLTVEKLRVFYGKAKGLALQIRIFATRSTFLLISLFSEDTQLKSMLLRMNDIIEIHHFQKNF